MGIVVELPPDVEAKIRQEAEKRGISAEVHAAEIIKDFYDDPHRSQESWDAYIQRMRATVSTSPPPKKLQPISFSVLDGPNEGETLDDYFKRVVANMPPPPPLEYGDRNLKAALERQLLPETDDPNAWREELAMFDKAVEEIEEYGRKKQEQELSDSILA